MQNESNGLQAELAVPAAAIYIDLQYVEVMTRRWTAAMQAADPRAGRIRANYWALADRLSLGLGRPPVYLYDAMPVGGKERHLVTVLRRHPRFHLMIRKSMEPPLNEQKEVDVAMAVDMVRDALSGRVKRQILVTGDRDFVPAVEACRAAGAHVTVANFQYQQASKPLRLACDASINLDELPVVTILPPHETAEAVPVPPASEVTA